MIRLRPGMMLDRLQLIKTEDDKNFRYGRVMLVKERIFNKMLTPFDVTNVDENNGIKKIIAMKLYEEGDKKFHEIDVENIRLIGKRKGYVVRYLDELGGEPIG